MAGNKAVFQEALKKAHSYSWDKRWEEAVAEYERALGEFPEDPGVHSNLGLAYLEMGNAQKALKEYQVVSRLLPDDPQPLIKIADVYEHIGQTDTAARTYAQVAQIYQRQNNREKATDMWQQILSRDPNNREAHRHLAQIYEEVGRNQQAAQQHLALARLYQHQGAVEESIHECEQVIRLDSRNAEARNILESLRAKDEFDWDELLEFEEEAEEEETGNPRELTTQEALEQLSEKIFESGSLLLGKAIDLQTRNKVDEAIKTYREVLSSGFKDAQIYFLLGVLYQQTGHYDQAIDFFDNVSSQPNLEQGSNYALAECYNARGQLDDALRHLTDTLKKAELSGSGTSRAEVNEFYEKLLVRYNKEHPKKKQEFVNSLLRFMEDVEWAEHIAGARAKIRHLEQVGVEVTMTDIIENPGLDDALELVAQSKTQMEQGLMMTAIETCYRAIQMAPFYIPLHLQLAEIEAHRNKPELAVNKCLIAANLYRIRGEDDKTIDVYRRMANYAPTDIEVRTKLIDLLTRHGQSAEALEQYIELGEMYYHSAQLNVALEKYNEALRLTQWTSNPQNWEIRLQHMIGDIHMQRVDWRQALLAYERIKELSPRDEQARVRLADLYYKLGRAQEGLREVDNLLGFYQKTKQPDKMQSTLEEMVSIRGDDIPLRMRLAKVYLALGKKEEAIKQLDTLGELQLNAGKTKEAIGTIKYIVSLKPANVQEYITLLKQLGK